MSNIAKPLSPEMLVPRIGEYLVEQGLITSEDLQHALLVQEIDKSKNQQKLLGQILVEMGAIRKQTLDQVITEQILSLRKALEHSNKMLELRVQERTAELEDALRKINELNQLKTNFISNISHELRTPLTHIKGYLELLVSKDLGQLEADQERVLEVMNRSTNRLERLIEDLIMFTFAEHDEVLISPARFDLYPSILEAIQSFNGIHPDREIKLNIKAETASLWVIGDQKKIAWVISHLIENAAKFSSNNKVIELNVIEDIDQINIQVKDFGIGIPEEQFDDIFRPFHQLDGSSTRRYGGVGLGLSLAQKIIQAHQSELIVKSEIGVGSQFDFSLRKLIK